MGKRAVVVLDGVLACVLAAAPAMGDGCLISSTQQTQSGRLAQTRQEVLMMVDEGGTDEMDIWTPPSVTYVLRSRYTGNAAEIAWVLPIPTTPTDVVAHVSNTLFEALSRATSPKFYIPGPPRTGMPCGCAAAGDSTRATGLVNVEASGQAGVYDWAALTSGGSTALVDWLNTNGFGVPQDAEPILQPYIDQGWHFLAVRVRPGGLVFSAATHRDIPPIQFKCETSRRVYPLVISRISAAESTELVVYVAGAHYAQVKNAPNGIIEKTRLALDSRNPSGTNYEDVFAETVAGLGGPALITEWTDVVQAWTFEDGWGTPLALNELPEGTHLTRLRTVLTREQMDRDLEFENTPDDTRRVEGYFFVGPEWWMASAAARPGAGLGVMAVAAMALKRRTRAR